MRKKQEYLQKSELHFIRIKACWNQANIMQRFWATHDVDCWRKILSKFINSNQHYPTYSVQTITFLHPTMLDDELNQHVGFVSTVLKITIRIFMHAFSAIRATKRDKRFLFRKLKVCLWQLIRHWNPCPIIASLWVIR